MKRLFLILLIIFSLPAMAQYDVFGQYNNPFSVWGSKTKRSSYIWEAEALAYFARMTVPPPDSLKFEIDWVIKQIKLNYCTKAGDTSSYSDTSLFQRLDELWLFANHTKQASLLGVKGYKNASDSLMHFTPYQGFNGGDMGGWEHLTLLYDPAIDGISYKVNSAAFGFGCVRDTGFTDNKYDITIGAGNTNSLYIANNVNLFIHSADYVYLGTIANNKDIRRVFMGSRIDTNNVFVFDNVYYKKNTSAYPSTSVPNSYIWLGSGQDHSLNSKRQYSVAFVGGGLSQKDAKALYDILRHYMHFVYRETPKVQVVCDGNSLTYGSYTTYPYPSQLQDSLGTGYKIMNQGTGSITAEAMLLRYKAFQSTSMLQAGFLYDPHYTRNVYIAWEGYNSMGAGSSADSCYGLMRGLCLLAKAQGYKVIIITCLKGASLNETKRTAFNTLLKNNYTSFADALYDADVDFPDNNDMTYFYTDKIHLRDLTNSIIASRIYNIIKDNNW